MPPTTPNLSADAEPVIRLRPVEPRDLEVLFELQTDPGSNEMAGTKPRTREAFFAAWARHFTDPNINGQVNETDSAIGPVIAGSIARFQAEENGKRHDALGYWLARDHWGKSIGSRAVAMFLAIEPRRPLHATAAKANSASRRILEKCGFRLLGFRMGEETDRFTATEIADYVLE